MGSALYHGNSIFGYNCKDSCGFDTLALNAHVFLHANEALCYNIVRNSVRVAFLAKENAKAAYKLVFIHYHQGESLTLLRMRSNKMLVGLCFKKSTQTRKIINAAAFDLVS